MRFNSKTGHEVRTWALFITGIVLVIIFAVKGTPINPWWTLIIGAFTCTSVVVSAVQTMISGVTESAKQALEKSLQEQDSNEKI